MLLDFVSYSRKLKIIEAQTNEGLFCPYEQEVWSEAKLACVWWDCVRQGAGVLCLLAVLPLKMTPSDKSQFSHI